MLAAVGVEAVQMVVVGRAVGGRVEGDRVEEKEKRLQVAAWWEALGALIMAGCDPEARSRRGTTCRTLAMQYDHYEVDGVLSRGP